MEPGLWIDWLSWCAMDPCNTAARALFFTRALACSLEHPRPVSWVISGTTSCLCRVSFAFTKLMKHTQSGALCVCHIRSAIPRIPTECLEQGRVVSGIPGFARRSEGPGWRGNSSGGWWGGGSPVWCILSALSRRDLTTLQSHWDGYSAPAVVSGAGDETWWGSIT